MKNFVAIVCIAFVLCIHAQVEAADDSQNVIDRIKEVMDLSSKLSQSIKQLLGRNKNSVPKDKIEKLQTLGGELGNAERDLSEQMEKLGDFLGVPKPSGIPPLH